MNSEEKRKLARSQPIGKALNDADADGVLMVDLDLSNPLTIELVAAYFTGGQRAANATLKAQQAEGTN
jgi:hypothetical protein